MIKSIYAMYIAKFFPKLQRLIEKVNGSRQTELKYFHKDMLRKEYSPDNKWESDTINTTYVAADYVSEDSEAPIKQRDSIATANGKLPKVSIARQMKESDMTKIRIMRAQGGTAAQIAAKLANDPVACANGIDERNEYAFLKGFQDGVVAIKDEENPNALLRLDFGYPESHIFHATRKDVYDIEDIKNVLSAASEEGVTITKIAISKVAYDALRKTDGAKRLVADWKGQSYDANTTLPVPSPSNFNSAFEDETDGVEFNIINRSVVLEKNGSRKRVKPFGNHRLVFYAGDVVGTLVYGRLAEQDNPVDDVNYVTIDDYKLISRYRETNPLKEMTTGQAFVAPIIEDVDQIFVLDVSVSAELDETAETADTNDTYVTINGTKYTKADVITALKKFKSIAVNATDQRVIDVYNSLNEEEEAAVLADIASAVVE